MTVVDYNVRASEARHRSPDVYDRPSNRPSPLKITSDPNVETPEWLLAVANQALELLELRPGWAGPNSRAVEPRLVQALIVDVLANVMPPSSRAVAPQLVPTREGGIQLEWHREGWDVEVEMSPYGRHWVDCEKADGTDMWEGWLSENLDPLRVVLKQVADR